MNEADTRDVGMENREKIVCGKFVDREKTSYLDMYNTKMAERFGPFYEPYEGVK
jgi:hypothetical protein